VKRAFDPQGLLNPGKAIPTLRAAPNTGRCTCKRGLLPFAELPRF
jgi:glycolate oxidase